ALEGGGRVLVHCLGGCGRSGMVALRLMIGAGETPEVALRHLRGVRPCAVETEAQLAWATGRRVWRAARAASGGIGALAAGCGSGGRFGLARHCLGLFAAGA